MTAIKSWNKWIERINNASPETIDKEIYEIESKEELPFVEKNLKLGYLHFANDRLGKATNIFHSVATVILKEAKNESFKSENEKGLNILYMGWRIVPDGCGGFDVFESGDCCSEGCGPICCCIGIAGAMAICGISADDITTCDTTDGQGCFDNCLGSCCGGCEDCGGC